MAAFISGFQAGSSAYGRGLEIRARREEGALNRALDERKLMGAEAEKGLRERILTQDLQRKEQDLAQAAEKAKKEAAAGLIMQDVLKTWNSSVTPKTPDNFNRIFGPAYESLSILGPTYAQAGMNFADGLWKQYQSLEDPSAKALTVREKDTLAETRRELNKEEAALRDMENQVGLGELGRKEEDRDKNRYFFQKMQKLKASIKQRKEILNNLYMKTEATSQGAGFMTPSVPSAPADPTVGPWSQREDGVYVYTKPAP
jgi:hypothetical protein